MMRTARSSFIRYKILTLSLVMFRMPASVRTFRCWDTVGWAFLMNGTIVQAHCSPFSR